MFVNLVQLVSSAQYAAERNSLTLEENIMLSVLNLKRDGHKPELVEEAQQLYAKSLDATFKIAQGILAEPPLTYKNPSNHEVFSVYTSTEMLIVKEAAKLALYDAEFRDDIADTLGITDDVIRDVSLKLQKDLASDELPVDGFIDGVLQFLNDHPGLGLADKLREAIDVSRKEISIIYDTSDVINDQVSSELTEEQAYNVLILSKKNFDMNCGITHGSLKNEAEYLYESGDCRPS